MTLEDLFEEENKVITYLSSKPIKENDLLELNYSRLRIEGQRYYLIKFKYHPTMFFKETSIGYYILDKK